VTSAAPAAVGTSVVLSAERLSHRYSGRRGLEPLSFSLAAPGAVAVTGANGSGKSTLLRIVSGLLHPTGGTSTLRVDGHDIAPPQRRHHIGLATPELSFYPEFTCHENLAFAAEAHGLAAPAGAAEAALSRVGLSARAHDRVSALSSGMKQRLRLSFALLHRPRVLLLDEPGSHMDEEGRQVMEAFVAEHAREGLVLIATNEAREWRLAERRIELTGSGLGDPA
jgi:ABC-type multidrug transport system ATPase subunit